MRPGWRRAAAVRVYPHRAAADAGDGAVGLHDQLPQQRQLLLSMGLLRNKGIWLVISVLLLMQLVIIYVPLMQSMFGTEALPLRCWFVTLVIGVAMFLVVEVEKRLTPVPQNGLNNLARLAAGARYCRKDPL